MIQTVRVQTIIGKDLPGETILHDILNILKNKQVASVKTARVYRLEGISEKEATVLAEKLFSEPINQTYTLNKSILKNASQIIEIAYKPGVMNPEIASITKAADNLGIKLKAADSSWEYGFYGNTNRQKAIEIAEKLKLFNPLIEHIVGKKPDTLLIKGVVGKTTIIPLQDMTDQEMLNLSHDKLFLNLEEMKIIQKYFQNIKRDPTDLELETLAQTWSEHSGHKTFKAKLIVDGTEKEPLIKRLQNEALKHNKHIVSAFVDNSGVMDFYDGYAICGKGETHNSPSAIEPYGGAMTGSGGVFRDIVGTGKGAKTIVSTDIFCLAPWDMDKGKLPKGSLPPAYILKRVVAAIKDYGNRMGIPTNNGSFHFHDDFRAKPTVLVGAYGIMPKKYAKKGQPKVGDVILSIGGRVGRDGIHGATFSSAEMTERTINVNAQAVQIGNAIEEKRMFDAILEARDKNCIRAIQDSGGGGLSSAIGEMGEHTGVSVHLENERLKYKGLSPWEIWLAESQERMILAIPKNKLQKFLEICKKYNVESSVLGKFNGSKKLQVYFGKETVCSLDMEFLHHGLPQRVLYAKRELKTKNLKLPPIRRAGKTQNAPKTERGWIEILKKVLSHGNICSKEPIVRRYDHTVQGTNAMQPYSGELLDGPNDASIVRPILEKPYGVIVSHGLNPILNNIDPYWGSIWAAAEAISNYVAVGGNYKDASLINNYIWPFPDSESLWSIDKSVDAVCDFMKTLQIPVISGKDSLSSTYKGSDGTVIKIPPVLCISAFGKIKDVTKTVSTDFKKNGSLIYLVGAMDFLAMAGSTYFDGDGRIPHVNLQQLPKTLDAIHHAIQKNALLSCHDISEGGTITSLFEMCVGGNMGAEIIINGQTKIDNFLFNETAGCFVVEVENEKIASALFKNVPYIILGRTKKEKIISTKQDKTTLFAANVDKLKQVWQKPMKEIFG
ncbi:MAG: phosphoribosylformylglycinamidine synthase [Candidatus Levyibacteriota bacterium]|nr:MAG: phosphoribosylformylglycinamidine synthase [Candidatus Levybacteria bacterium]